MDWNAYNSSSSGGLRMVHSIGEHGVLHIGELPHEALDMLREHNARTGPDDVSSARGLFSPRTLRVLHQAYRHESDHRVIKCPDGILMVAGPQCKLLSVISDEAMCRPPEDSSDDEEVRGSMSRVTVTPLSGAEKRPKTVFFSVVHPPDAPPARPLYVVHHDGLLSTNEVSRFSPVNSIVSHIMGHVPLQSEPRMLMTAPSMGTVLGRQLVGPDAEFIKRVFLDAMQQQKGKFFHRPMDLSDTLSKMLMMRDNKAPVCCARLKDGIAGFRTRADGKKSLVFAASSPDFNASEPSSDGGVRLLKISYSNRSADAPRVFLKTTEKDDDDRDAARDDGLTIFPDVMSMADVAARLERNFRVVHRNELGCGDFHRVCVEYARTHLGVPRGSDPHSAACRSLLATHGSGY